MICGGQLSMTSSESCNMYLATLWLRATLGKVKISAYSMQDIYIVKGKLEISKYLRSAEHKDGKYKHNRTIATKVREGQNNI